MCGIVGVASTRAISARGWLAAGRDAIAHRGPDDAGEYWAADGRVGLGHRRLSIIDLSPLGHQPMQDASGRLTIAFNGEIYNYRQLRSELSGLGHRFVSNSDTEVVLASYLQWGRRFLERLDGMFAIGLFDLEQRVLVLARDRAGEKPLFFRATADELRFASELKALFADPSLERRIDPEALDCYLTMGYIPGSRCIIRGIQKLEAGHALAFSLDDGGVQHWRYWSLPDLAPEAGRASDDELVDALENRLATAVGHQLVADVPVALLLSGGVDSSLITALAVRAQGRVKTFTVRFRRFGQYDETAHAQLVADHFGTAHTVLEADEVEPDLLGTLARQYDEPIVDSSMIPTYLVSRQISHQCKVALGGDGGDELFGGYHSASRMAWLGQHRAPLPYRLRQGLAHLTGALLPTGAKGRVFMSHWGSDWSSDLPLFAPQFDRFPRRRLMRRVAHWLPVAEQYRRSRVPRTPDAVQRITRFDFANYLTEDILVKVDRASMLNSLEVRSPFLDRHVVEFAFGMVPSRLKATADRRKILLRRLAARLLPAGFDQTRKQGFGIPLDEWLKAGPWRQRFEDLLYHRDALFDRTEVKRLFAGLQAGRPVKEQLFALAFFEMWRREYAASL